MSQITPTVFATSKQEFNNRFNKLIKISKNIQIDFMDGKFVKAKSPSINSIPNLKKYKNNFEAHIMVFKPEKYIKKLKQKGFSKIIFHIESQKTNKKIINTINKIKKQNLISFIALNPETQIRKIQPFLKNINGVLIMGVHPGKERQHLLPTTYKKIKQLRKINKKIPIQVDGGVSQNNIKNLANAGANLFNTGSYIAQATNPKQLLKTLNSLIYSN